MPSLPCPASQCFKCKCYVLDKYDITSEEIHVLPSFFALLFFETARSLKKKNQIGNNLMRAIEQRKYNILSGRNPIFRNFEQILISPNLSNWSDDKVNQK